MPIALYLNGTDDHTDGTLATAGNGITLGEVESVVTVHLRSPAGYANAEAVTVPAPVDCHVSADGVTYGASATYGIGAIPDTNTPCHVKRVVNTVTPPGSPPYRADIALTPRAALVAVVDVAAPVIAGTLTAVAGGGQVTLSGPTATDNAGIAKWQYRVDAGAWVDIASTAGTMPSTVVSGLTAGTTYAFDVRALDAAGNASAVRSATSQTVLLFSDDFSIDGALDSALWSTSVADGGIVTKSGGSLVIDTTVATDAALVAIKSPVTLDTPRTYRTKFKIVDAATTLYIPLGISQRDGDYPVVASTADGANLGWNSQRYYQGPHLYLAYSLTSGTPYINAVVNNTAAGTNSRWNTATDQWVSGAPATVGRVISIGTEYVAEITTDSAGVIFRLYEADGSTLLFQTAKRLWSEIMVYDYTKYVMAGEPYTNVIAAEASHDYFMGW